MFKIVIICLCLCSCSANNQAVAMHMEKISVEDARFNLYRLNNPTGVKGRTIAISYVYSNM